MTSRQEGAEKVPSSRPTALDFQRYIFPGTTRILAVKKTRVSLVLLFTWFSLLMISRPVHFGGT